MTIVKLILILLFIYFSSKSLGICVHKRTHLSYEICLGIGYALNIAIFFLSVFIPMYFRLSSFCMMCFGIIYLLICLKSLYYSIKVKELFKFPKKEILAIVIGLFFTVLFFFVIDYGYAELTDSYFYSALTNSGSRAESLSIVNPYSGVSSLQTYYKYLSFYYQSSFFANILGVVPAYLVLIWPFTFMTYFFLGITALGIARISEDKKINNIISIFVITLFTVMFREPYNALRMVNCLFPLYIIKFAMDSVDDESNVKWYYVFFIAAAACTSAILYTTVAIIVCLFIAVSLKKKYNKTLLIYKLCIPIYLLGMIYVIESRRSIWLASIFIVALLIVYLLLKVKFINKLAKKAGVALLFLIPIFLVVLPLSNNNTSELSSLMTRNGKVNDIAALSNEKLCILQNVKVSNYGYDFDYNSLGNVTYFQYKNPSSLINTVFVLLTHSVFMYGGMLAFLVLGFFKRRKDICYLSFIAYLLIFVNPLLSEGLNILTMGLNWRIRLFCNAYFAILGLKELFEFIKKFNIKFLNFTINYAYIPYAVLVTCSIISYAALFKLPDYNNFDFLYKVPKDYVSVNEDINELVSGSEEEKPVVLYTIDTFALTMIDKNPNNKYKIINSKEYRDYYANTSVLNNKFLLSIYFDSNGFITFDDIASKLDTDSKNKYNLKYCNISDMLSNYNIKYIVLKKTENDDYSLIEKRYKVIYDKNNFVVLERL